MTNETLTPQGLTTRGDSGHTPGPWSVSLVGSQAKAFGGGINDKNGNQIALVTVTRSGSPEERQANARLIVAAPELLDALRNLADSVGSEQQDQQLAYAYQVIAKAAGKE